MERNNLMVQTGRIMTEVKINKTLFCMECKKTETIRGEDERHITFQAWSKGWSPTLALCPECYPIKRVYNANKSETHSTYLV